MVSLILQIISMFYFCISQMAILCLLRNLEFGKIRPCLENLVANLLSNYTNTKGCWFASVGSASSNYIAYRLTTYIGSHREANLFFLFHI